jgi:HEAT repeat protein
MGRAESWKVLVPYLNDAEAGVRATTVVGLTNLGVREGIVEIVKRMSQETDRAARAYMAAAAQRFKMREAIEPLIAWISPDEPELSQAAAVALQTITGQSLGSDREKWSQWWEKNRGK